MRSGRRHPPSPAAAGPLDDDDLLAEILLRLPPQPSSLPRASAVCRRWRSLASDPGFSRRFRIHHRRNLPLLGCFMRDGNGLRFKPTLDPPNRVPQGRFPFPIDAGGDRSFSLLGCRHGLILTFHTSGDLQALMVWDPVNGHEHRLAVPPGIGENTLVLAAVLRAAALGDIHHFQVVLVSTDEHNTRLIGRVYSSETGVWGNLIATPLPPNVSPAMIDPSKPDVLLGDSLYMLIHGKSSSIVEFDVGRQSLALIPLPVGLDLELSYYCWVMRADGGGLGLLFVSMSECSFQLWKRKTGCDGVASWVLAITIELDKLLSLDLQCGLKIQGFAEENNVVFLRTFVGCFMVQLDSLQFKKLPEINLLHWRPFEYVYAAGI